jgi:hypothetical protein
MDKFIDAYALSKLNQQDMNHLNRTIIRNEIEVVIKTLQTKKSPGLYIFTTEFYQTIKEELTTMLLKLFYIIERERALPNSLYEASIILKPKLDKDTHTHTQKKL